jgi:hypothetical protein
MTPVDFTIEKTPVGKGYKKQAMRLLTRKRQP